jgi:hypothetical protein
MADAAAGGAAICRADTAAEGEAYSGKTTAVSTDGAFKHSCVLGAP